MVRCVPQPPRAPARGTPWSWGDEGRNGAWRISLVQPIGGDLAEARAAGQSIAFQHQPETAGRKRRREVYQVGEDSWLITYDAPWLTGPLAHFRVSVVRHVGSIFQNGVVASVRNTIGSGSIPQGTSVLVGREQGADQLRATFQPGDQVQGGLPPDRSGPVPLRRGRLSDPA
jgi:hypothetical protein